jgi:hypothetical protein
MTSLKWFCPLVPNRAQKVQEELTEVFNGVDCFAKPDNVTLEAISKLEFSFEIKAKPRINP